MQRQDPHRVLDEDGTRANTPLSLAIADRVHGKDEREKSNSTLASKREERYPVGYNVSMIRTDWEVLP